MASAEHLTRAFSRLVFERIYFLRFGGGGPTSGCLAFCVLCVSLQGMRSGAVSARADVGSYDALFAPLMSAHRHRDVLALFADMRASGLSPLEPHFRLAISAAVALRKDDTAVALLHRMQQRGMRIEPSASHVMTACNRAGNYQMTIDIFEALQFDANARSKEGASAQTSAIGDLGTHASSHNVDGEGDTWRSQHLQVFTYNALLQALRRMQRVELAVEMLLFMEAERGVAPDETSYAIVIGACKEEDRQAEAVSRCLTRTAARADACPQCLLLESSECRPP
eukprot:412361-Pleurochrysis_carterae.AAC.3